MSPRTRRIAWIAAATALVAGIAGGAWWHQRTLYPKRFGVVVEGRLYRSGGVTPEQLERLVRDHGIRAVLSLLDPGAPESVAEQQAARRLGLKWYNVPLPGDGASRPQDREQISRVLSDADNGPLLVHCAAGANRTGLAVGIFRIHEQGWTVGQVLEEMRRFDFEDLPHHQNLRDALAAEAAGVADPSIARPDPLPPP